MATFRKVNFEMRKGNGYGQYVIEARYRGAKHKGSYHGFRGLGLDQ